MRNKVTHILVSTVLLAIIVSCKSGGPRKVDESSLVRVAIVKLVNASGNALYDYLSDTLTDAAQNSMDKKFVYNRLAADQTTGMFTELKEKKGELENSRLRGYALELDADLVIFGHFTSTQGKRGDSAEIVVRVFRSDKSTMIAELKKNAVISAAIFKDIDNIAAELVRRIGEYRLSQIKERGEKESAAAADQKVEFTRESINIAPFIPPVF